MTSRVDNASSVQDAEVVQKAEEQEQRNWSAEWKANYHKPASPQLSQASNASSVEDAEIERLKEKIASLKCAQAAIKAEGNEWQAKYRQEHEESSRLSNANAKQDRMISSLEDESFDLRAELTARDKKITSLEAQTKTFSELQLRQKKKYQDTVAQLRSQLDEKDRDNASIQADLWMLTNDLHNGQTKDDDYIEDDLAATNAQISELEDTKETLAIAEIELEAFYATLAYNKQIQIQYDAVLAQNIELMRTKNELLRKVKHTERSLAIYRTKSEQAMDRVCELADELELLKSDSSSNIDEPPHEPGTFFISLSTSENSSDSPNPRKTPKLTFSVVQTQSTRPCPPKNLLTDPEFCRRLHEFETCITTLTTPCLPTFKPRPLRQIQASSPPLHAHITLTIQPSTSSWTLLQRAQSALSRSPSSSLSINGPSSLVTRFVDEMRRLETHHAEQTKLAVQWEKVAGAHMEEARVLREELDRKGCSVSEHRWLLDELKAKDERCEMLVGLLWELQGRSA